MSRIPTRNLSDPVILVAFPRQSLAEFPFYFIIWDYMAPVNSVGENSLQRDFTFIQKQLLSDNHVAQAAGQEQAMADIPESPMAKSVGNILPFDNCKLVLIASQKTRPINDIGAFLFGHLSIATATGYRLEMMVRDRIFPMSGGTD